MPSHSADIPGYQCQPFLSQPIQQLWATYHRDGDERALRTSLHQKSLHFCENALCECDLGNQPLLPLPHDMMHISDGICKPIFELIVDGLTPKERTALDELCDRIFKNLKNSRSSCFPRMNFDGGLTSLTLVTSAEKLGILHCWNVLSNTRMGRTMMEEAVNRRSPGRSGDGVSCQRGEKPRLQQQSRRDLSKVYSGSQSPNTSALKRSKSEQRNLSS